MMDSSSSSPPSSSFSLPLDDETAYTQVFTVQLIPEEEKIKRFSSQRHKNEKQAPTAASLSLVHDSSINKPVPLETNSNIANVTNDNLLTREGPTSFESDFSIELADAEDLFEQFAAEEKKQSPSRDEFVPSEVKRIIESSKDVVSPLIDEPSSESIASSSSSEPVNVEVHRDNLNDQNDTKNNEKALQNDDSVNLNVNNQLLEATFKQIQDLSSQTASLVGEIETVKKTNSNLLEKIISLKEQVKQDQVDSQEYLVKITEQLNDSFMKLQQQVTDASSTRQLLTDQLKKVENNFAKQCSSLNELLTASIDKISHIVEHKSLETVTSTETFAKNSISSEDEIINSISLARLVTFLDEIKQDIGHIKSHQDLIEKQFASRICTRCDSQPNLDEQNTLPGPMTCSNMRIDSEGFENTLDVNISVERSNLNPSRSPGGGIDREIVKQRNSSILESTKPIDQLNKIEKEPAEINTSRMQDDQSSVLKEQKSIKNEINPLNLNEKVASHHRGKNKMTLNPLKNVEKVISDDSEEKEDQISEESSTLSQRVEGLVRKIYQTGTKYRKSSRQTVGDGDRQASYGKVIEFSNESRSNVSWSQFYLPRRYKITATSSSQIDGSQKISSTPMYPWKSVSAIDRIVTNNSFVRPSDALASSTPHTSHCQTTVEPIDFKISSSILLNDIRRTTDILKLELDQLKQITSQGDDEKTFIYP